MKPALSGEKHDILLCSQKERKMEVKEKKMEYVEQKVTYKDAIYEDDDVKKDIANCQIKVTLTSYNLSSQLELSCFYSNLYATQNIVDLI